MIKSISVAYDPVNRVSRSLSVLRTATQVRNSITFNKAVTTSIKKKTKKSLAYARLSSQ
ncbi:protein of unknown function [Moritella yayanosii]|uniref:Uncharacterized protein n=1 Tax=Moritella yayanosii TaxID=69539 RepID=A0A330LRZ2_9GAMM|nr:protein of unknown function [Moritella yayanosii]